MDYARSPLLLREWEMNDAGSLARVSLTLHRLGRAQRATLLRLIWSLPLPHWDVTEPMEPA